LCTNISPYQNTTFYPYTTLFRSSNEDIIIALETLADNKKIIISKDRVTLPSIYYAEHKSSEKLSNIINYKIDEIDEAQAKKSLKKIEKSLSIQYSDKQRDRKSVV